MNEPEIPFEGLETAAVNIETLPTVLPGPLGSTQIDKVIEALASAHAEMRGIPKDEKNPFFSSRYSSLDAVISESREQLGKYGLALIQQVTGSDRVTLRTVIAHKSGQWIDFGTLGVALTAERGRSLAQSMGALITYLRRYGRTTALQLASEDNDGNAAEQPAQKPAQQTATPRQAKPAPAAAPQPQDEQKPHADDADKWDALRLRLLNRLTAAPGQKNRQLVIDFLLSKQWIKAGQEPEMWPTAHIPLTKETFDALIQEILAFEQQQKAQVAQ